MLCQPSVVVPSSVLRPHAPLARVEHRGKCRAQLSGSHGNAGRRSWGLSSQCHGTKQLRVRPAQLASISYDFAGLKEPELGEAKRDRAMQRRKLMACYHCGPYGKFDFDPYAMVSLSRCGWGLSEAHAGYQMRVTASRKSFQIGACNAQAPSSSLVG